ncbi:MAG: dihydrofolate reductase [Pseudomonadota bacterium]|nr:MAG: dihydrofolate reductase [Pseudomonadota bacterium]
MAQNRVIGIKNGLPWHLPNDLKHFRRITTGHPIIMGRKNFESIGKPLPQRTNIVVTRDRNYSAPGCIVVHSLAEALAAAEPASEAFIIGGAQIYEQALPTAKRMHLTLVHADVSGDTRFPDFVWSDWRIVDREDHNIDDRHGQAYSFLTMERITA